MFFVSAGVLPEGFVEGAIGAGLAFGGIYILKIVISNLISHRHDLLQSFYVTQFDAVGIGIVIVLLGALIGLVGSVFGLYRFLEE